jgi:hypothetical protein
MMSVRFRRPRENEGGGDRLADADASDAEYVGG